MAIVVVVLLAVIAVVTVIIVCCWYWLSDVMILILMMMVLMLMFGLSWLLDSDIDTVLMWLCTLEMCVSLSIWKHLLPPSYKLHTKMVESSVLQPSIHGAVIPREIQN